MNALPWSVVCFCAAWCRVCREWQPLFDELAHTAAGVQFAWIDVEDDADRLGDWDVETFPTVLIAQGDNVLFCAPVAPQPDALRRLIAQLQATGGNTPGADAGMQALWPDLRAHLLPQRLR